MYFSNIARLLNVSSMFAFGKGGILVDWSIYIIILNSTEEAANPGVIVDQTETNLIALRRTIYLTIQSSLDFEECAHKLLKLELKPGQEV